MPKGILRSPGGVKRQNGRGKTLIYYCIYIYIYIIYIQTHGA